MPKLRLYFRAAAGLLVLGWLGQMVPAAESPAGGQVLYAASTESAFPGPESWFTGGAQVQMRFPGNANARYSVANVNFQPGARTVWHEHPAGQLLLVLSGTALTGTRDGKVLTAQPGDAVWCPPGVDHWHGASAGGPMEHLAVTGFLDGQNVLWKEPVADDDATLRTKDETTGDAK